MKNIASEFILKVSKINRNQVEIILAVVTLGLLVLSAGAPEGGGGIVIRGILSLK